VSCSACQRARGWLPRSIRKRLEEVERRMRAEKIAKSLTVEAAPGGGAFISTPLALTPKERADIVISYTTAKLGQAAAAATSPRPLPALPPGGEGGA